MIGLSACGGRVLNRGQYDIRKNVGGAFTGPVTRHLMYYVWPRGEWRSVMREMTKRLSLFNGVRCLAVSYSDLEDVECVRQEVGGDWDFVLPCPNVPELREVTGFLPCLERCLSSDPNAVIFTAHAKGVTHAEDNAIRRWTREMYTLNLDYWPFVESALQRGAMCGAFRRVAVFPKVAHATCDNVDGERWHYSGSFYWIRSKDLFARDWRNIDMKWYGSETYPGIQFKSEECQCLVGDGCGDLYRQTTWDQLQPEIEKWKSSKVVTHFLGR